MDDCFYFNPRLTWQCSPSLVSSDPSQTDVWSPFCPMMTLSPCRRHGAVYSGNIRQVTPAVGWATCEVVGPAHYRLQPSYSSDHAPTATYTDHTHSPYLIARLCCSSWRWCDHAMQLCSYFKPTTSQAYMQLRNGHRKHPQAEADFRYRYEIGLYETRSSATCLSGLANWSCNSLNTADVVQL